MKELKDFWRTLTPADKAMVLTCSVFGAVLLLIAVGLAIVIWR